MNTTSLDAPHPSTSSELQAIERELYRLSANTGSETLKDQLGAIAARLAKIRLFEDMPARGDKRVDLRSPMDVVTYYRIDSANVECALSDLSRGGALLQCDTELPTGTKLMLAVPGTGEIEATVRSTTANGLHVTFMPLTPEAEVAVIEAVGQRYDGQ